MTEFDIPLDDDFSFGGDTKIDDPAPQRLSCEVCGAGLTYAGRGRKPRFCSEHKPGSKSTGTTTRKRSGSLEVLRRDLEATLSATGMGIAVFNMFDGAVIMGRSGALSDALIGLAEKDPKFRKALEAAMRSGSYLQLLMVCGSIIIPIMWNHGIVRGVKDRDENGKTVAIRRDDTLAPIMFNMAGVPYHAQNSENKTSE